MKLGPISQYEESAIDNLWAYACERGDDALLLRETKSVLVGYLYS